uniref:GOLD domain-containing protein n=1 Tax=Mesocestoides corti TaxID=53468 RepID=A0A5K3EV76_MESCO
MRSILDQQSIIQFRQYAQEQHPKDIAKVPLLKYLCYFLLLQQEELIQQMQDQYFTYYMENVQRSQMLNQQRQIEQLLDVREAARASADTDADGEDEMLGEPIPLPLVPASMWTRKDIAEFKKDILANQRECCVKISSLASATLRVPTIEDGTGIFWEFATDSYDLGFGLFFEWDLTPQENITMTISESSDEEDDEEVAGEEGVEADASNQRHPRSSPTLRHSGEASEADVESGGGGGGNRRKLLNAPPTDELVPVYRRDCHLEVYCGSHQYPGCGVYVFKFDNSFSLWRSKWLYYRIRYAK